MKAAPLPYSRIKVQNPLEESHDIFFSRMYKEVESVFSQECAVPIIRLAVCFCIKAKVAISEWELVWNPCRDVGASRLKRELAWELSRGARVVLGILGKLQLKTASIPSLFGSKFT